MASDLLQELLKTGEREILCTGNSFDPKNIGTGVGGRSGELRILAICFKHLSSNLLYIGS